MSDPPAPDDATGTPPHARGARYVHTNIVARDWRRLARFYEDVFACRPVRRVHGQRGSWLDRGVGVEGCRLEGVHLRLPGAGADGPTLEIYEYAPALERPGTSPVRPGLGHLAFHVDDVEQALEAVVTAGGSALGRPSGAVIEGAGTLSFVYAADPEGNVLELQTWG